jgi:hypothetical protein
MVMARLPAATGAQGGGSGRIEADRGGWTRLPPAAAEVYRRRLSSLPLRLCERRQWEMDSGMGHGSDRRGRLVR